MNNQKVLIAIIVILLIALGIALWMYTSKESVAPEVSNNSQSTEQQNNEPDASTDDAQILPISETEEFEKGLEDTTTNWVLTRVTVDQKEVDMNVNVASPLTLQFDTAKNSYKGFAGCNNYSGTYSVGKNYGFDFGAKVSTKMACGALELENAIFSVMDKTVRYGLKGGNNLVFENEDSYTQLLFMPSK